MSEERRTMKRSVAPELDETVAPLVFAYILAVVASLGAILAWVFWYRGYA